MLISLGEEHATKLNPSEWTQKSSFSSSSSLLSRYLVKQKVLDLLHDLLLLLVDVAEDVLHLLALDAPQNAH